MDTLAIVRELANERSLTLFRLSHICDASHSPLKSSERRGGQLSVDTIERICDCLGIELYQFFMDDTDWELLQEYVKGRMKK